MVGDRYASLSAASPPMRSLAWVVLGSAVALGAVAVFSLLACCLLGPFGVGLSPVLVLQAVLLVRVHHTLEALARGEDTWATLFERLSAAFWTDAVLVSLGSLLGLGIQALYFGLRLTEAAS